MVNGLDWQCCLAGTVKLGDKELFGLLKLPNVPYHYEVNSKLVTGNGSLTPISSLSNRSLSPSLTVAPEQPPGF